LRKSLKSGFEPIEATAIEYTMRSIYNEDFIFFKQTITYFLKYPLYNAALGKVLVSFPDAVIGEIIADCFSIDQYHFHVDARDELWKNFSISATDEQKYFLLKMVYLKWKAFIQALNASDEFYLNNLLLTDFANMLANYYCLESPSDIINETQIFLKKIKYVDTEWAKSQLNQITNLYLNLSELYLLSFAYKNMKIMSADIKRLADALRTDEILNLRYFTNAGAGYLKVLYANLNS
jgi:hypothetical protein